MNHKISGGFCGCLKKSVVLSLLTVSAVVISCSAEEVVYSEWDPDGSGNWSDTSRWKNGIVPPATGANLLFSDCEAYATDADYSIINNSTRIRFKGTASLDLRFDEDHLDFRPYTVMDYGDDEKHSSLIIKSGTGRLVYTFVSSLQVYEMDRLIVTNGVLQIDGSNKSVIYGAYGDGKLEFNGASNVAGLEGDGTVTNLVSGTYIDFCGGTEGDPCVYAGAIDNTFMPRFKDWCYQDFTGESTASCTIRFYDASIGVSKFGMSGVSGSLGSSKDFWFQGESTLRYLGAGETTDKTMHIGKDCDSLTVDGGAGGLIFNGTWGGTENAYILPLILTGTNTEYACVLDPKFSSNPTNGFNLVKRGPGIWRLGNTHSHERIGTVTVEEGTLEYDSISEKGADAAIGAGSFLSPPVKCLKSEAEEVPWFVMLGTHSTTGRFVYAGADDACYTSRLFAVRGYGAISSKNGATLRYRGAYSSGEGGGNLILDGSGGYDSFTDVTNGVGALSVTKTGSGTWTLCGDVVLGGGLDVEDGTLHICNSTNYTWYRLTVEDTWGPASSIQLSQLGFYDENGVQQNLFLEDATSTAGTNAYKLLEGCIAWEHDVSFNADRSVTNLFTGVDGLTTVGRGVSITSDNPASWLSLVMRLPAGSAQVKYYDIKSYMGLGELGMYFRDPKCWNLEGSVDGRNWVQLDRQSGLEFTDPENDGWYSLIDRAQSAGPHGFGISGSKPASRVSIASVGVSGGGRVVVDEPVTVSALRVDAVSGGTIDGFAFAKEGTLDVRGYNGGETELPVTFENVTGLGNLSGWTLMSAGEPVRRRMIRVSGGKVSVVKYGLTVSIR